MSASPQAAAEIWARASGTGPAKARHAPAISKHADVAAENLCRADILDPASRFMAAIPAEIMAKIRFLFTATAAEQTISCR
jgi:hypothetical protein